VCHSGIEDLAAERETLVERVRWWWQAREHRQGLLLLAPILLLATVLRIGWPTLTEFKFSEARLEALALELTREGRLPLVGVPSSAGLDHSPISVYLYAPTFLLTTNPILATIYGGLIGTAAVALCWWLARHWAGGGRGAAWIAALLFAVSPWSVAFSRKIWQVVFVPFLALAFVGLIISALTQEANRGRDHVRQWGLAWALVTYALLVQVHPSAVALLPALLLWLILFWREVRLGPLFAGIALASLTGVPFLVRQAQNGWPALAALRTLPPADWDLSAVRLAWEAITGRGLYALAGDAYPLLRIVPELGWAFNLVGWLLVTSALWLTWRTIRDWGAADSRLRQQARVDLIILTWLTTPILFNLRHSLDLYLHFFALVLPAAYLVIGRAAQDLFRSCWASRMRAPGAAGLGFLATSQIVALGMMGHFVATHDTSGGFGVPLGRYLAVTNQVVATASDTGAAEVLVVGQGDSTVVDETPAIFDVLLRGRVAYRFVDGQSTAVFPSHPALALLTPGAGEAARWYCSPPFSSNAVQDRYLLIDLGGALPQVQFEPLTGLRLFRNGVEAQGYTWQRAITPGEVANFWLLWQVVWLSPDDTHFYVHLLNEGSQPIGQQDSAGYPLAYRHQGDRVVSKFDITIGKEPPADPYWARIGQYLYPQVMNVPLIDQAGNPAADAIVVGPWDRGP
jgi:hypothetical protein